MRADHFCDQRIKLPHKRASRLIVMLERSFNQRACVRIIHVIESASTPLPMTGNGGVRPAGNGGMRPPGNGGVRTSGNGEASAATNGGSTGANGGKSKIIALGHSRLGKTTLVAGAFDDRFALVAPAGSGCAGTGAFRFNGKARGGKEGLEAARREVEMLGGKALVFPIDVTRADQVRPGDGITVRLREGALAAEVSETRPAAKRGESK